MDYNVIYYYTNNELACYIEHGDDLNEYKTIDIKELNKPEHKFHSFGLLDGYEKNHESLIRFKQNMITWMNEIKSVTVLTKFKKHYNLKYYKYFSHNDAAFLEFKRHNKEMFDEMEFMNKEEYYIHERCRNSGLMTLNNDFKNKPTQCYGYDFTRFYVHQLLNMKIPKKQGKKESLKIVEYGKLKFGIYRIHISGNKQFLNIFNTCKEHHYTGSTINQLYKYKDKYDLTFELLEPDEQYNYNALIYEYSDLIRGSDVFKVWFDELEQIRSKFPKNKLVKMLMTTLWGQLTSFKKVYIESY